ncbi:signal transduction histidine kinase [Rhodopseudomonas rhenobacensis]|uniref:histidine kinase n=1 Tax=Rhodopseudomonas rhenobacensis TaxID=87461 RepID=A0A7W8DXS5_9BRAD|nr:ATP-binding protein [Rhodopseudomonas rhenobacensis]MBB5046052.1 signal transduction histidine kinase [Rhodopseudomonas rhenobacensis]
MSRLGWIVPKRISGQIAAIVVISITVIHAIVAVTFFINRPGEPEPFDHGRNELTALVQILGKAPTTDRPALLAALTRSFPQFEIAPAAPGEHVALEPGDGPPPLRHLGRDYRQLRLEGAADDRLGVALPDGELIALRLLPDERRPPLLGGPVMVSLLFVIVSLTLLGLWAARALSQPLSSFARAAENFRLDHAAAPLPERGPEEIRSVARALNDMRARIAALVDDRTKMLAAISHDLRTPITRLRLRCEFIEDEACRNHMLRDLDQMRSMLESVLSFLRNDRNREAMTLTDIATTLQLIADQFTDAGQAVGYRGPAHATMMARPDDLHRAVTNLVENAVRFGAEATIGLSFTQQAVTIDVADDGPGISDAQKSAMLQPFVRGDDARNMDEASGFGLGLSIAQAVAIAHGGVLSLNDRRPHGLIVRITLPLPSASDHVSPSKAV